MIEFTNELHNHLVDFAAKRSAMTADSKKKAIQQQHTIFITAITTIDFLNGQVGIPDGKSCLPPGVWVNVLRGELIEKVN